MVVTKEAEMGKRARKPMAARAEEPVVSEGAELPERWSVQRKTELVLRLLRGEALESGTRGLKTRAEPEEREPARSPGLKGLHTW
jgi:hypothetical protein